MNSRTQRALTHFFLGTGAMLTVVAVVGLYVTEGGFATTHTRPEFEAVIESTNRDTRGAVFYRGRKDGFDYFKARWNFGSRNLRVAVADSPVTHPFGYRSHPDGWREASFMHLEGVALTEAIDRRFDGD